MRLFAALLMIGGCLTLEAAFAQESEQKNKEAFAFEDTKYFFRSRNQDAREYTPAGQDDLKTWKDMVTVIYYRNATDEKALEKVANTTKGLYQQANGLIIRAAANPKTAEKPAAYLVVAMFVTDEFREVAFAGFRMQEGVSSAVVYSHRIYGKEVGEEMGAWIKKNGPNTEIALAKWDAIPKIQSAK